MRRFILSVAMTACLVFSVGASSALATPTGAWWKVTSEAVPTNLLPGGDDRIVVDVVNLGYAPANGAVSPIVIKDALPPGLTVSEIVATEGGLTCTLSPLSCTDDESVAPYTGGLRFTLSVKVAQNAVSGIENRVSVRGGESASTTFAQPMRVSSAATSFGVESYEMIPSGDEGAIDEQAGSHPFQLTTTFNFNKTISQTLFNGFEPEEAVGQGKDLHFELPAGMVGNPRAVPQCSYTQFTEQLGYINHCPSDTAIGVVELYSGPENGSFGIRTGRFVEPVFNLAPSVGEPARFGFIVEGIVRVYLDTSVRTGGDYGVTVEVNNIEQLLSFSGTQLTIWGVPGDPRHNSSRGWCGLQREEAEEHGIACGAVEPETETAFLTLPTSCGGAFESTVLADSWEAPTDAVPAQSTLRDQFGHAVGLDGCNRLNFSPTLSVTPDGQAASTPTGLTVGIHIPQEETLNPGGLAQSHVKTTTVALPVGVQLSPAAADGLLSCSLEQVSLQTADKPSCPESSKVGTVEIQTPLLPNPIVGGVYLAAQDQNPFGTLLALYILAEDPASGVLVKLAGKVMPDIATGQLVSTFENTPQLPFEDLKISFFGSSRAPLTTPPSCGLYTTMTSIEPWSGNPPATPSSTFAITTGPNGIPCGPQPFTPDFQAGSTNLQAGAFTPFELTMSRPDADQTLSRVEMQMPPGLLGTLSTVKLCPEPQASEGTCGEESLIGHTIVSAGLGGSPYTVTGGKVFVTTGYKGAPYGLSIVNPAKAGPFDLGTVIVRASIFVDPRSAALRIVSDPLPTILDGIPLQLQHVQVVVERPDGFTFNPTDCNKMAIVGTLSSTEGKTAQVSTPFQVTNCATLAFKPKLTVSTAGKTSRANGASLHVKLTYPEGPYDANIAKVKVDLPKQLPSRLTTLQKACPAATFAANPASCPAASIVGHAKASTPVLPVPLEGPAYFVSHAGEEFPDLIVVLQGYGATVDLVGSTYISKAGITSSTFKDVPDVPVGTFELTLPQGKYSALAANVNLCAAKLAMPTAFVGQNGAEIHASTHITATGCVKHGVKRAKAKSKHKGKKR